MNEARFWESIWQYERAVSREAWKVTIAELDSRYSIGAAIVLLVVGVGLSIAIDGPKSLQQYIPNWLTLGPLILVGLFLFGWARTRAPVTLVREEIESRDAIIKSIKERNEVLEERLRPKLKIRHGLNGSFMETTLQPNGLMRLHRIEVKNESDATSIRNVKVQIESITQQTNFLPVTITEMNDRPPPGVLHKEEFTFNPAERRYFTVVGKREGAEPRFFASYAVSRANLFEDGLYEFGILVTGENILPQKLKLKVWADAQGRLCMEEKL